MSNKHNTFISLAVAAVMLFAAIMAVPAATAENPDPTVVTYETNIIEWPPGGSGCDPHCYATVAIGNGDWPPSGGGCRPNCMEMGFTITNAAKLAQEWPPGGGGCRPTCINVHLIVMGHDVLP